MHVPAAAGGKRNKAGVICLQSRLKRLYSRQNNDTHRVRPRRISQAGGPAAHFFVSGKTSRKDHSLDTERISSLIEPSLQAMGYGLVRVLFTGGRRATLQIMAERVDEA